MEFIIEAESRVEAMEEATKEAATTGHIDGIATYTFILCIGSLYFIHVSCGLSIRTGGLNESILFINFFQVDSRFSRREAFYHTGVLLLNTVFFHVYFLVTNGIATYTFILCIGLSYFIQISY